MYMNEMTKTKSLVLDKSAAFDNKHVLKAQESFAFRQGVLDIKLELPGQAVLLHDKHDRIVLSPGNYRSYHQFEFNPMDGTTNRIFD